MRSLYAPQERATVAQFLQHRFGTLQPQAGHENIWRLELTRMFRESALFAMQNFFVITDKHGREQTMRPQAGQAMLDWAMESQRRNGLPVRTCSVKARQLGFTLWFIGRGLHYAMDEHRRSFILVDDENVAKEQATRLGMMINGLPGWLQPMRRIQNLTHIVFENPNPKDRMTSPGLNSAIQTTVPASFRGVPPGFVQVSEYAHMTEDRQLAIQMGIISALPLNENTFLVIDTTPNGFDVSYYPLAMESRETNPKWMKRIENWQGEIAVNDILDGILGLPDSVEKNYAGVFVPAFWPWRLHEEYSCKSKATPRGELPALRKEQREETEGSLGRHGRYGGEEELELRDRFGVSTDRLYWRRRKIDSYSFPTDEMRLLAFRQEFLTTFDSAFIDSGTAPFDRTSLDALDRQRREPIATGLFRAYGEFDHHAHSDWQQIRVYAPPQNGERYCCGIDTGNSYENMEADATVAQILRVRDFKVVATYESHVSAHTFAEQFRYLYRWYFDMYYAVEVRMMGYQLARTLFDAGLTNVHYWKRYDVAVPEATKYLGWETNERTRPLMDQTFLELACHRDPVTAKPDPLLCVPDEKTLREIRGLVRRPNGAFEAKSGFRDDHYVALCIALCIARDPYSGLLQSRHEQQREQRREFESWFKGATAGQTNRNRPSLANL